MDFVVKPIKHMANHPLTLALVVLGTLLLGAVLFQIFEGAGMLDGLYWASTTLTSVGYGDFSPVTTPGKVMTIVFQLWSLFILLPCAVANIIDSVRIDEHKQTHQEQEWEFERIERICDALDIPAVPQPEDY